MAKFPADCLARKIGSKARAIVHYQFDAEHWDFHEQTGNDYGVDCWIELSRNGAWNNEKIEGQIKGSKELKQIKSAPVFSFQMEKKTILYALNGSNAFVLFLVDVSKEIVYYLPLQDYFISDPKCFDSLDSDTESMAIHVPVDNILSRDDYDLQCIAQSRYIDGPGRALRKEK